MDMFCILIVALVLWVGIYTDRASLIAHLVKNPPAMQESPVQFLSQEDSLEKEQATHSSILGIPQWLSWQRDHLQCGRPGFDPWVGKILWRRERLTRSSILAWRLPWTVQSMGHKESDTMEQLSLSPGKLHYIFIEQNCIVLNFLRISETKKLFFLKKLQMFAVRQQKYFGTILVNHRIG